MDIKELDINRGIGIDSVQDRDYWRAPVNAVLNPRDLDAACRLQERKMLELRLHRGGSETHQAFL